MSEGSKYLFVYASFFVQFVGLVLIRYELEQTLPSPQVLPLSKAPYHIVSRLEEVILLHWTHFVLRDGQLSWRATVGFRVVRLLR